MYSETHVRSLTKTLVWRFIATCITWATIYFFTRESAESFKIAGVGALITTIMYYAHERVWNLVYWGKRR